MTQINPYSAAILQSSQVQQRANAEHQRQLRRLQNLNHHSTLPGDRLEHQVESTDHSAKAGDDEGSGQGGGTGHSPGHGEPDQTDESPPTPDDHPHIDIRA